jgi:SAM-dependent methyltransferase
LRNPFLDDPVRRYAWAWDQLTDPNALPGPHLELGIGDGAPFASVLARSSGREVVAADAHAGYLAAAREAHPSLRLVRVEGGGRLPFHDAAFATAGLLDVLEHVEDEATTVAELARVVRPGGRLVVSVPARYALSFLDPDDVKYRFPRAHRAFMSRRYPGSAYDERFVDVGDGLVGDLAATRDHHHNYRFDELCDRVCPAGFEVVDRAGSGFIGRQVDGVRLLTSGRVRSALDRLVLVDGRWFHRAHLFVAFRRA